MRASARWRSTIDGQVDRRQLAVADHDAAVDDRQVGVDRRAQHQRGQRVVLAAREARTVRGRTRRCPRPCPARDGRCRRAPAPARRRAWRVPAPRAPSARERRSPTRCSSNAWRASASMCDESFDAEPSTPRPTCTPASSIARTGAIPDASRMFDVGQCATPVPVLAKRSMPCASSFTQCACQTCGAGEAQLLRIIGGRAAEAFARKGDVVVVFGEMRVQAHAIGARKRRRLAHQVARHREGRARRRGHAQHREAARVVAGFDDPARVREDRVLVLDERVRRQAAAGFADAHRAAAGVEAQADRARRV